MLELWCLTCFNSNFFLKKFKDCGINLPLLFLIGESDQFTSSDSFFKFCEGLKKDNGLNKLVYEVIVNSDHFWRNDSDDMKLMSRLDTFVGRL